MSTVTNEKASGGTSQVSDSCFFNVLYTQNTAGVSRPSCHSEARVQQQHQLQIAEVCLYLCYYYYYHSSSTTHLLDPYHPQQAHLYFIFFFVAYRSVVSERFGFTQLCSVNKILCLKSRNEKHWKSICVMNEVLWLSQFTDTLNECHDEMQMTVAGTSWKFYLHKNVIVAVVLMKITSKSI